MIFVKWSLLARSFFHSSCSKETFTPFTHSLSWLPSLTHPLLVHDSASLCLVCFSNHVSNPLSPTVYVSYVSPSSFAPSPSLTFFNPFSLSTLTSSSPLSLLPLPPSTTNISPLSSRISSSLSLLSLILLFAVNSLLGFPITSLPVH